ncbi:hypothetical protein GCM10011352_25670 [Marinobacterium zhoushanense]|uniref:Uncharacterized protein n=1 Tax=Marinobacterium zhoushanense TaxID=1679163 RepID=A0ABQ1KGI8_9GAMM|nr:hypothetical protein GCM10011352_25670 [Marinobacterium zhoushanense]
MQQRPVPVPRCAFKLLFDRRLEIHDKAARLKVVSIFWTQNRTASRSQYDPGLLRKLVDNRLFAITKSRLSFDIEDPGNISSGPLLNSLIRVDKFLTKLI